MSDVEFARRCLDILLALPLFVLSVPMLLVIVALIKLDSPGPVIFKHQRVGINRRRKAVPYDGPDRRRKNLFGRPFVLYKFRTMFVNSRELYPELYAYRYAKDELEHLPIKVLVGARNGSEDPRHTRVGRWLRKTSLDELPNLINVLKGDMHLVGPRPDMPENVRYYPQHHMKKLRVRPGVTGLAQISGRGHLSFLKTNDYDLAYIENRSLWLDVRILLKTIITTLKGSGAY